MRGRMLALAAPAAVLALGVLAGCGSDSEGSAAAAPSETPTTHATDLPFCSDVWVADKRLPTSYKGCETDGQAVKPDRRMCSSGQTIVTYDNRFYAVLGGPVQETESLRTDKDFRRTLAVCQG